MVIVKKASEIGRKLVTFELVCRGKHGSAVTDIKPDTMSSKVNHLMLEDNVSVPLRHSDMSCLDCYDWYLRCSTIFIAPVWSEDDHMTTGQTYGETTGRHCISISSDSLASFRKDYVTNHFNHLPCPTTNVAASALDFATHTCTLSRYTGSLPVSRQRSWESLKGALLR